MKLLIGGSPCTHWSIAQTKNRETEPSGLGWELFKNYLIALEKYKPDYFLYENNKSMSAAIREQITRELGVEPILINSALVSAQNRQRLYWTNIPGVQLPEDRGILLRDILESGICWREKGYALLTTCGGATAEDMIARRQRNGVAEPICLNPVPSGKSRTVDAHMGKLENNLVPRINNPNPAKQQYDRIAEPLRIGVVEGAKETGQDYSKQYKVYSPDAKGTALCGNGGGMGAKTGLYAVPCDPIRVGALPNKDGEPGTSQSRRIYSVDGKGVPLQARPNGGGADGATTGLYAVPAGMAWRGRGDSSAYEMRNDQKANAITADGHQSRLVIEAAAGRVVGRRINEQGHRDDYNEAIPHFQYFEVNENPQKTNCPTTVTKDNMIAVPAEYYGTPLELEIEAEDGKKYPVYEVRNGQITIKGKQYPIKLADGFYIIRKLTVTECKRLQTVPESYVFPTSQAQAYKMLGNGWTVDVIAHILQHALGITEEPVEVLSMYDGMSCGHLALDKLGATITRYYATEIDKYAIQTTQHNYPDTVQLGDAFQVRNDDWSLPELAVEDRTTTASKGGNTMQIKKTVYEETTWERVKALATGGEATEALPLHTEITMNLEDGETVTVEVAAHLPATEDKPAGVRFVFKDCLSEPSSMNDDWTNVGGYKASKARRHVLEDIFPKLPADLRAMIRPRKITEITGDGTLVYEDPLWLPSETDLFGRGDESWQHGAADGPDDFQLPIFKTERDRVKQRPGYGTTPYWLRSVYASYAYMFCLVRTSGSANASYASSSCGVAPGFDL